MKKMMKRKGQLNVFKSIAMGLVVIGILVGVGLLVLASFKGALTTNSAEYNATDNFVTAIANVADKAPTAGILFGVALIIVGAAVALAFLNNRQSGF